MASGTTRISDVVTPEIFTAYARQLTENKDRLVQSGVMASNSILDSFLAGGGTTINVPSWKDLDNDTDNVSTDETIGTNDSTPKKIGSATETAVRLSRNQSWSSMDLAAALAGEDPMGVIAEHVAKYWTRRRQAAVIATMNGVIADNVANDSGDYVHDISNSGTYAEGVTDFSAEAFIDAALTLGDSMEDVAIIVVHSVVMARMKKNNLIDFIPDARGEVEIPTFLGREVIVDDGMPATGGVYDSWLFGRGFLQYGVSSPKVPTEIERDPKAGNGGGQETLYNRVEWAIHPTGHAYTGASPAGGPDNTNSTNMLAAAGSWNRVYTERKQIKFARLVTCES